MGKYNNMIHKLIQAAERKDNCLYLFGKKQFYSAKRGKKFYLYTLTRCDGETSGRKSQNVIVSEVGEVAFVKGLAKYIQDIQEVVEE